MNGFDTGDYHDKFSDFYSFEAVLGKGAFGRVVQATSKSTGDSVAVKIIHKQKLKASHIAALKREATIMKSLKHPNIIEFKHIKETETRILLEMELVLGLNLHHYLQKYPVSEDEGRLLCAGVLSGVMHIHSKNIIHRDIKPQNILVAKSHKDGITVKITDFGLSTSFNHKDPMESDRCGTLLFMAPEQQLNQFYSAAVDIWSCGLILYIVLSGQHPLFTAQDTAREYIDKLRGPVWSFPPGFPERAKSLFLKMVEVKPIDRYSAAQALNHPWITNKQTKIPLSTFEAFVKDSDVLKLKSIAWMLLFTSALRPVEVLKEPEETQFAEVPRDRPLLELPKIVVSRPSLHFSRRDKRVATASDCPRKRTIIRLTSSSFYPRKTTLPRGVKKSPCKSMQMLVNPQPETSFR